MLRNIEGKKANHIYNIADEGAAKHYTEYNVMKTIDGDVKPGTGTLAIYYSVDRDELDGTLAPEMKIPEQLQNEVIIRVSDTKKPTDGGWQKSNKTYQDQNHKEWILTHEKYGVLCGGQNKLCAVDFDDAVAQQSVIEDGVLPLDTFTVRTARKKLLHLYFYLDRDIEPGPIKNEEGRTLLDIQYTGRQVVGPGTRIPTGNTYDVVKDVPIKKITADLLFQALYRFSYTKTQEALQRASDSLSLDDFRPQAKNDTAIAEIKQLMKVSDVLREAGISAKRRGNTKCPFHTSVSGKCLGFDDEKDGGIWHCFNCLKSGDAITLWMGINNIEDFIEAKKKLCEKYNIKDTYVVEKKKEAAIIENGRPMQRLPCKNYTLEQFAVEISRYFKGDEKVFFKPDEDNIVEVKKSYDTILKKEIIGFRPVDTKRLLNIIEKKVNTYAIEYVKKEEVMVRQTPTKNTIELLSANEDFQEALYTIRRFLSFPLMFLGPDGKLITPKHQPGKGYYDPNFQAYFTPNTPELKLMTVSEAKYLLQDILNEFCFKDKARDTTMALAFIITPMCRGIYKSPTARTPIFIISANRERAGKDYLAGIRGIIYEGQAIDDTPIVTGEKNESNNDELRKKLTAALKTGRRLFHSSNNRGFLNNATLEQFSTSEVWRDRELGRNNQLELNNEVDISLSANIGLTYTADLHHRSRPIELFYSEENPNERAFKRTDLHGYILSNRAIFLSAIYTLVNAWVMAGMPSGKLFTSFPEWARVVGGIMEYHGLGNPCISIEDARVGGDKETQGMKELCSFMAQHQLNDATQPIGYSISDLRRITVEAHSSEDLEGFSGWDMSDRANQVKFGNLIRRFVGREFHSKQVTKNGEIFFKVRLIIAKDNERSNKILYGFPIEIEGDKKLESQKELPQAIKEETIEELMPKRIVEQLTYKEAERMLLSILASGGEVYIGALVEKGISDEQIIEFINSGIVYNSKPGYVRLLQ